MGTPRAPARSRFMLEFLGSLLWPVVIVASTIAIAFAIGVFMATRKLD
jgi:hypothetical protein